MQQRPVRISAERREEHRGTEPVVVHVLPGLPGAERPEEEAAVAQPEGDSRDQAGLLLDRDVSEHEECNHRVEGGRRDLELHGVAVHEAGFRNVMARQLHLDRRNVDAGDAVATRKLPSRRDAAAAAELEHIGAVGEARVQLAHPVHDRGLDLPGPLCVAQSNRVVAASDDLFRFTRNGAACHLPHARRVTNA